jgi:hypothetical protein
MVGEISMVGATLLIRSFLAVMGMGLGFQP